MKWWQVILHPRKAATWIRAARVVLRDLAGACQQILDNMDDIPLTDPKELLEQMSEGQEKISGEDVLEVLGVDPLALQFQIKNAEVVLDG